MSRCFHDYAYQGLPLSLHVASSPEMMILIHQNIPEDFQMTASYAEKVEDFGLATAAVVQQDHDELAAHFAVVDLGMWTVMVEEAYALCDAAALRLAVMAAAAACCHHRHRHPQYQQHLSGCPWHSYLHPSIPMFTKIAEM